MGDLLSRGVEQRTTEAPQPLTFEWVYARYYRHICSYLQRLIDNVDDAQDLATATFEKVYRNWEKVPQPNFLPWLYRIATNTCLDELRRRRLIRWQPLDAFVSFFHPRQVARDNPERDAIRGEQQALIRRALDRLNARQRAALLMRECEDLSCEEIGVALGISKEAAKQLLFRARQQLKAQYLALGGEPLDG